MIIKLKYYIRCMMVDTSYENNNDIKDNKWNSYGINSTWKCFSLPSLLHSGSNFHPSCFCKIYFVDTLLLIMFMGFIDHKKREAKSYWLKFWWKQWVTQSVGSKVPIDSLHNLIETFKSDRARHFVTFLRN